MGPDLKPAESILEPRRGNALNPFRRSPKPDATTREAIPAENPSCDRCCASAKNVVWVGHRVLYFCRHHFNKLEAHIIGKGYETTDLTDDSVESLLLREVSIQ